MKQKDSIQISGSETEDKWIIERSIYLKSGYIKKVTVRMVPHKMIIVCYNETGETNERK